MLAPGFSGQNLVKAGFMPIARHRVLPNSSEELAASTNVAARAFVQFARRMPLPVHYALENEPAGSKVGMLNLGGSGIADCQVFSNELANCGRFFGNF